MTKGNLWARHRGMIRSLQLFSELEDAELDRVLTQSVELSIDKGTAVFEQGRAATSFYLLIEGHLKVVQITPDGQQLIIRFVVPGDLYGIAKALNRDDYPATALALVDSLTLAWSMTLWDDFMRLQGFAGEVVRMIGGRVQEAHTRLKEMATQNVEQRVAQAVLRLVRHSGRKVEQGVLIDFPVTRQDIAEASGTTLHSVSRILSAWEGKGMVAGSRKKVIVRDLEALEAIAERGKGYPGIFMGQK
jgi:CRP-like cAMP-binding protein